MFGGDKGVSFTLRVTLELTDEEAELVRKYKLESYPLTWRNYQGNRVPGDTVSTLRQGISQTVNDVTTLVNNEEVFKAACDELPVLFDVVRTFGGSEVIEYPRS